MRWVRTKECMVKDMYDHPYRVRREGEMQMHA